MTGFKYHRARNVAHNAISSRFTHQSFSLEMEAVVKCPRCESLIGASNMQFFSALVEKVEDYRRRGAICDKDIAELDKRSR